ncbi:MAG: sugar phosphate isomerase/epimerase [Phycisphaerae bacterium]|nr:sugar phosphate isomerase/epimerase [Phycisphaerae bacterium]
MTTARGSKFSIGVVANCLKLPDPAAAAKAARDIGIEGLQVYTRRPAECSPQQWADTWRAAAGAAGVRLASAVTGFPQEDYSSIAAIHRTGGLVPDDMVAENIGRVRDAVEFARAMGVDLLTFHAGFIPERSADPVFVKLRDRVARCGDLAAAAGVRIGLESGQESAVALKQFLAAVNKPNVGVNFDPANLILYGRQDPIEAVDILAPHIFQVHAKDGVWSAKPGEEWGKEVPLGSGDVEFPALLAKLAGHGFAGFLVIEREAGKQPLDDIRSGVQFLRGLI